jgi:hypothetical protein
VKKWFGRKKTTEQADAEAEKALATETQQALTEAQRAVAETSADHVNDIADAYKQALADYLTGKGMPKSDAQKIAPTVREETLSQVRIPKS